MDKVGQTVGQSRDAADPVVPRFPAPPRGPDEHVVLVNQRLAVWDRRVPLQPESAPIEAITDPVWNHRGGRVWTPDLVHCRLLNVGDTIARLPSPLRRGYVSLLGDVALTETAEIRRPPTAAEISIADWTWSELLKRPATQRAILQAMAFGASVRKVSETLARMRATKVGKTTISRWYITERRALAARWIADNQLVDGESFQRWRGIFERP